MHTGLTIMKIIYDSRWLVFSQDDSGEVKSDYPYPTYTEPKSFCHATVRLFETKNQLFIFMLFVASSRRCVNNV